MKLYLLLFLTFLAPTLACYTGNAGQTWWCYDCVWYDCPYVGSVHNVLQLDCGEYCVDNPDCTSFHWYLNGTCSMYNKRDTQFVSCPREYAQHHICGWVKSRA